MIESEVLMSLGNYGALGVMCTYFMVTLNKTLKANTDAINALKEALICKRILKQKI